MRLLRFCKSLINILIWLCTLITVLIWIFIIWDGMSESESDELIEPTTPFRIWKLKPKTARKRILLEHNRHALRTNLDKIKSIKGQGLSDIPYCNNNTINPQDVVSRAEMLTRLKESPRSICKCAKLNNRVEEKSHLPETSLMVESTCSAEATLLGKFQKVISYSLFKPRRKENSTKEMLSFFEGIYENLELMKTLYPGWVMRIYSDLPLKGDMCNVVCSSEIVYYCNARHLPTIGSVQNVNPTAWRYLLVGDGTVEKFAVRDLDSRLSKRERTAVEEWERSNFAFHGMRDHVKHTLLIMSGMWGGDNYKICLTIGQAIRDKILNLLRNKDSLYYNQQVLGRVIYLKYRNHIMFHDSYTCTRYMDSVPFPTKRENNYDFVGSLANVNYYPLKISCPVQCRPVYGLEWNFC